jgi:hypothetical protein
MRLSIIIVAVSLLAVLAIGGCVTTTSDVPGHIVVRNVISALFKQFPASTNAVARYFKNGELGRLKKVVKTDDGQRITDYEWTSADGDCFMYFMTDQKVHEVHHAWAKCSVKSTSEAHQILTQWAHAALPGVAPEQVPSEPNSYRRVFTARNGGVAVALALDEDDHGQKTIRIGFRSGVTAPPEE